MKIDWFPVIFIAVMLSGAGFVLYKIRETSDKFAQEAQVERDWRHRCVEAGGSPVALYEYTRGYGVGNMCIKLGDKIEVSEK